MAKNLAPTPPADKQLANELSLKAPSSPAMLDPSAVRATSTAPTDKGPQGVKSGAVNARLARKKSGLLNDPADAFDESQSSPSQDTVLVTDRPETGAATESMGASSTLNAANMEASGAEISAYGAQQATVFGEPLVLAQAVVDAPSVATLSSASANASAAAAASASSIGAGGFMALAGMIVAASRAAATNKAPTNTETTTPLSLVVQDGYLDGAEVWVDMNDNGVIDTLVDFKFGTSVNGKVDGVLTDAQKLHALITTGGTDISTGLAFQGSYSATAGSTVVNPLTSLVQSMVQSSMGSTAGMTASEKLARITEVKAEALAAVNSALGLPVGADLTRIDTISTATASTGDVASGISLEQALVINSKALMVANMMAMGAAALQGASSSSGGVPSMSTFSDFIVQGIVDAINTAAANGETVALGDSDSLTSILTSASTAAATAATAAGASFAMDSTKLSAANAAVATSVASTNSLITTLTGNAITANAINPGSATGALTQMLAAQKAVLSQLDELQDNDVSVLNTFSDVAAVFTASQSAENTAGLKLGTQAVTAPTVVADTVAATVARVTVEAERVGDLAQFVVQMTEGLFVKFSGEDKPTIAIQNTANSTATAVFDPGASTGNKLVFTYRVQAGDTQLGIAAGTTITLPGTSVIKDLGGNNANLSLDSGLSGFTAVEVIGRVAVDTQAPLSPTIALGLGMEDGATSTEAAQNTGVVTITAETGASTVVTFTNGQKVVSKTVTGNGATAVPVVLSAEDVNKLGEGEVSVRAVATDAAGNASAAGVSTFAISDNEKSVLTISSPDLATAIDENIAANTLVYTATSPQEGVTFTLNQAAATLGDTSTITQTSTIRVTDTLAEGVTLTRGTTGPLFSSTLEDGSPSIEWNSDGWAHLGNVAGRTYTTFAHALNDSVGNYILPAELVIHDRVNDTYYKVDFTQYQGGGVGGAFSYQRTQIMLSAENNFDINDQGEVFLTVSPDYETDIAYEFTVVASDGQGNTVQKTVTLPINNLDDTAPVITSGNTARTLVVDSGADQLVYTVTADDSGDISTGTVTYSLAAPPQAVLGDAVEINLPSKSIYRGMDYTDVIAEGVGFSRGIVHEGFAVTAEWNTDGWDNLGQVAQRAYDIEMPDNFDALVLHDIFSDRYYKFDFSAQDGGYTRTEILANGNLGNPVAVSPETLITTGDAISAGLKLQVVTHANTYTYQSSGSTEALDFVWSQGNVLDSNVSDRVMVHFQGQLTIDDPDGTGLAQALAFQLNHDDSLYIQFANANGQFLGSPLGVSNDTTTVTLTAGQTYLVDVWYQEDGGDANLFVGLPANAQWSGTLQYDTFAVELGASGQWAAPWSASNLKAIADDATPGDTFAVISFDSNSLHARPTVEWNDDGWADLSDLKDVQTRVFDAEVNGGTATTTNWVMHDTVNDTYYTVDFSKWSMGGNGRVGGGGGFAYDRQLIDLSGRAPVLGEAEAVYVPDGMSAPVDRLDSGVELTRFWAQPLQGVQTVEWNADGWGVDLTDVATRNYTTNMALAVMPDPDNYDILDNVVLDREWLMHDLVNDTYYKVQFQGWQQNANGGGFAYTRSQIDTQTGALLNTVEFTKSADTPFDLVDTGVVISRGIQRRSPLNSSGVEWNGDGWYDLEDLEVVASRDFYTTLSDALNDNWTDAEFVMRDLLSGRYYKIDVTDWQEGGGGAVSYVRSEIIQQYDTDLTMGGFAIDPVTGEVRLLGDPLPANSPYHLIVVATDAAGNVSYQDVSMVVQPNYAPTFEMVNPDSVGSGDVVAFANLAEGVAYQAVAADANAGTVFTYGLLDSTDAALFTIDTATGAVRFKQAPDMTQPLDAGEDNIYNLTITASDGVNTPPTELAVSIEVLVPPSIAATASADFTENETGVVFTAEAVASYLTYSLAGADAALFEIDADTGELRFLNVPDYETPLDAGKNNVYDVSVVANTYNLQVSQQVSVSVSSVYEAPVMVGASSAQTAENSKGTVYTARATAEADSTLTYALGGADAALFSINKDSGAVAFLAAPNYEDPLDDDGNNLYELTVTADDGTTASKSQSVVIAVTNVIEPSAVNVTVSADTVTEGDAANLVYTFTRSGDIDRALKVNIGMGGTATAEDYASNAPLAKSWSRLVGGSGADYLYSIAATADGGFYTVGTARYYDSSNPLKSADGVTLTPLGEADVFIRKYGSYGTQQWTRLFGGANDDAATSVVVGSDGSAYVAGYGNGPNGSNSTFIVKYSAVGALDNTWELTGLFPSNWVSRSLALAPDEATLFVGGWFFGDGRESYITKVTLSPDGTPGEPETFTLSKRATSAIAAASDGSVYLTGFTEYDIDGQTNAGGADAFVSKLDSAGLVVWSRLIGGKEENFGTSVLVGPDGSVYVAGGSYSSIFISKFDSDGLKLWEQSIANGRGADSSNYPCSLAMGSDGWVYLSGIATQDIGDQVALGDNDAFLSQINPDNGAIAWTRIVGSEGSDRAMAIAASPDGEVYIGGFTDDGYDNLNELGGGDGFVTKFAPPALPTVTFAPGSTTATLTLKATADQLTEGDETVSLAVLAGRGYALGTSVLATATIEDIPAITSDGSASVEENSSGTVYTATATDANVGSTLAYALAGTDADLFSIDASTGAVSFKAAPDFDAPLDTGTNNVYNITVTASNGVKTSVAQAVAITVTNLAAVNVTVSLAKVAEGDAANLVYTLTRSGDTDGELTVNMSLSGSATGSDFTNDLVANTTQVTFAAGSSTATLAVQAMEDQLTEDDETVTVTVLAGQGYELGETLVATGTIEDKLESHGTAMGINSRINGSISVVGETDLYSIQLTEGEKYVFTLEADSLGLDAVLNIFATRSTSSESLLLTNDNAFYLNNNARITYTAQGTGTYYLQANGGIETSGDYVLSVSDNNTPTPSRIPIPYSTDIQWKYVPNRGTGAEFYLIVDSPPTGLNSYGSPYWDTEDLPSWTDSANRSFLVDIASGQEFKHNGDLEGMRSGNIFAWDGPTVQSHVMQDLSINADYVYVVPRGAITGANGLTNDYYESTIYHTTADAVGPKAISGGVIMNVFSNDTFFPIDLAWGNLKLDDASSNTYSEPYILDDVPDLLWIQFDEKIRSSAGGWNQGWAAKHNDVFDGVYLKENGVAILEFDVNFDDVTHDPNQWGAPFRYPTGLLNVKTTDSEVVGGLPSIDYSGLENGMWLNLHQAVSSWGDQYAYADYVNNYQFKEDAIYTLVVDAPIEDIYFNTSDISTPLFEFSFIINPTQQQVL